MTLRATTVLLLAIIRDGIVQRAGYLAEAKSESVGQLDLSSDGTVLNY